MGRIIGVVHKRKRTAEGEERPTQVAILEDGKLTQTYNLADERAEFDFVTGHFPTAYRLVEEDEDLSGYERPWQIREKKKGKEIPAAFEGFKKGDTVALTLGGSGAALTAALFRIGESIGARVVSIPSFTLKQNRTRHEPEEDHLTLAELAEASPELFSPVTPKDITYLQVLVAYRDWKDAQAARIAAAQRVSQRQIGRLFLDVGLYPEKQLLDRYQADTANDKILVALELEEGQRKRAMDKLVEALPLFERLKERGIGKGTVAAVVAAVGNISRFEHRDGFVAYLGVHCRDGKLARRRSGEVANWVPSTRTAIWNFVDIACNRHPDSFWGTRLRVNKVRLREKHPEVEIYIGSDGKKKKRYTDGHIHKMAVWRTATQVARWIYNEWKRLDGAGITDLTPAPSSERTPELIGA